MNNHQLLTGCILESKKTKVYNHWPTCSPPPCQVGCRYNKILHKLKVKIDHKSIKTISVFTDKLTNSEKVLAVLASNKFTDKRYCFNCLNYFGKYHLLDWEELDPKNHVEKT